LSRDVDNLSCQKLPLTAEAWKGKINIGYRLEISPQMTEIFKNPEIIDYSALLVSSFAQLTGKTLLAQGKDIARELYEAPFALVSHGTQADPIFRYANQIALELWKMTWDEFTVMPSRLSAEPMLQAERDLLLAEANRQGYIDTYQGVRIAKDGQRFFIQDTVLWNVEDLHGTRHGQACIIHKWDFLPMNRV
jgi:MEKHLA domain